MADRPTLMAHLIPRITGQVENAATEALAYILNRSESSMQALNGLMSEAGSSIAPIVRAKTQVTHEDGSRPDMVGYDANRIKRLVVEVKFWATLLEGQASGYARQLGESDPAVLLFIAPEARVSTLWAEIRRQIEGQSKLIPVDAPRGISSAELIDAGHHVVLVSWPHLLDRMDAMADSLGVKSDIGQLRGLVKIQDDRAFLPIHPEELSPSLGSRMDGYSRLIDDVVESRGVQEGWMDVRNARATPQGYRYGRYFRLCGVAGDFWFGVNHKLWASGAATPLWLNLGDRDDYAIDEMEWQLHVKVIEGWIPIYPRLRVEYDEVVDSVASQIRRIAVILTKDGG